MLLLCVLCAAVVQHARDGAGPAVQDAADALHASLQPRGRQPLSTATAAATAASSRASGAAEALLAAVCGRCIAAGVCGVWDRMSWQSLVSHSPLGGMGTLAAVPAAGPHGCSCTACGQQHMHRCVLWRWCQLLGSAQLRGVYVAWTFWLVEDRAGGSNALPCVWLCVDSNRAWMPAPSSCWL